MKNFQSKIKLNQIKLDVNLGVTEEERKVKQTIIIDIIFYFDSMPNACLTDNIDETICYFTVFSLIEKYLENKEFKLIEFLCYEIHKLVIDNFVMAKYLKVAITKKYPPIKDKLNSASFEYDNI